MRVLLANSTCKVGGVSTFMVSLRRALMAAGHECEFFFFEHGTMEPHLPSDARTHFGSLADCVRLVARTGVDVVHANNVDWATGISAVRRAGARLVLTAHKVRDEDLTYGWTRRNCDGLVTVSRWVRDDLQPFTDVPIQVVHNGIDVDRFTPGDSTSNANARPIVAWVGRGGSPWKRLDRFAAVAPFLHAAGARIWIIDQHGPERVANLYPEAVRVLAPIAEAWGPIAYDRMPQMYRDVASSRGCVISTSEREGLPLALLEAQACGAAIVASDVRGNNECASAERGAVLFPFSLDGEGVARIVLRTIGDAAGRRQRETDGIAYARGAFSLEQMAANYLDVYRGAARPAPLPLAHQVRSRLRQSPLLHWPAYLAYRWGTGHEQYDASCRLARAADWTLAAAVARASVASAPTLYLKPHRLAHLIRTHVHRGGIAAPRVRAPITD